MPVLTAQDHPAAEIFGGYQYTRVGAVPGVNANGWNAAVTYDVTRWLGATADFSGAYRNIAQVALRAHTYTFGPTFAARGDRVTPFAHVLLGGFRGSTGVMSLGVKVDGFALLIGGGLDVKITRYVSARPFQVDWITWRTSGVTEKKNARISAGVVFSIY